MPFNIDLKQCSKLLCIWNAKNNHWVLLEINLDDDTDATVQLYDSLCGLITLSDWTKHLKPLFGLLNLALKDHEMEERNWNVSVVQDVAQQSDGNSCGVLAMVFAREVMFGHGVSNRDIFGEDKPSVVAKTKAVAEYRARFQAETAMGRMK